MWAELILTSGSSQDSLMSELLGAVVDPREKADFFSFFFFLSTP